MITPLQLSKVYTPPSQRGFLGEGHVARPVIQGDFAESDPFIVLMDDMLDKKDDEPAGGPHPHAGFETVTLMLEGEFGSGEHRMNPGDFEMMTAGHGIVHTETIDSPTQMRLLQLWLNLPLKDRHTLPRVQKIGGGHVPTQSKDGVTVRVYSGTFAGLTSPVLNHTPVLVAEIRMSPGARLMEKVNGNFTTFIYVIEGAVTTGEGRVVVADQVGWFRRSDGENNLSLEAGNTGARVVLYAGEPQLHEIVSHGPFIADSMEEIRQRYADFRHGKLMHINDIAPEQRINW